MHQGVSQQQFDRSKIKSERILRALAYWEAKKGKRRVPDRADFDPVDIPDIMPHVVMWDVLPQGYRCRLAGTKMVEIHGREMTGIEMSDFHGIYNATIQREYDGVVETGIPHYVERSLFWMDRDYRNYVRILLPLTNGDSAVKIILNVAHFDEI